MSPNIKWSILRSIAIVLIVTACTALARRAHLLDGFENASVDAMNRLHPLACDNVVIADITADDYKSLFLSRSPLNPATLNSVIDEIAKLKPRALVVDLDTSDSSFSGLRNTINNGSIPVIWGSVSADNADLGRNRINGADHLEVLGGTAKPGLASGFVGIPVDYDGIVRRYFRTIHGVSGEVFSLPWMTVKTLHPELHDSPSEILLRFAPADKMNRLSVGFVHKQSTEHTTTGIQAAVNSKVVVLGGDFAVSRYATPAGSLSGSEILANAIETELQRQGITGLNESVVFGLQILLSAVFVAFNLRFPGFWAPIVGLLLLPVATFFIGTYFFLSMSTWINFAPALFAVQLQYLYEHTRAVIKRNRELARANTELERTRIELARAINRGAENERQRIARELHDDTLGNLLNVSLMLSPLTNDASNQPAVKAGKALELSMKNLRSIMSNLYPSVLEKYGLTEALEGLVDQFNSTNRARATLEINEKTKDTLNHFDRDTQLPIYRIVQQALANTQTHANAGIVTVKINRSETEELLVICVADDGSGMAQTERKGSYGTDSMRNHSEMCGGSIEWLSPGSTFGKGTDVVVRLPLNAVQPKAHWPDVSSVSQ